MSWRAELDLSYHLRPDGRTVLRHRHDGPLRVLQSLYPEGAAVCHNVLVHAPGGLVGGDTLAINVQVASGAHALITTPGATRFYRCDNAPAVQHCRVELATAARLEWLPLETLAYNACQAENRLSLHLADGAEMLGWDVTALGLPEAGQPFRAGRLVQHTEWPGHWLERGVIDAADTRLLDGPLGLAGQRCLGLLFFACATPLALQRQQVALELAHALLQSHALRASAGLTSPQPRLLLLRVLGAQVEPVMQLLRQVWAAWRLALWQQVACVPRIWSQ